MFESCCVRGKSFSGFVRERARKNVIGARCERTNLCLKLRSIFASSYVNTVCITIKNV